MTIFDPDAHIDSASPAVGLTIDPAYREGVKRFLLLAAEMADALNEADLDASEQAHAPVFTPPKAAE